MPRPEPPIPHRLRFVHRARPTLVATLLCAVILQLGAAWPAAADKRVLTPQDVVAMRDVDEAVISPSGELIAYVLEVPRRPGQDPDGSSYNELHIVDREGHSRPYVTGPVSVNDVTWTHDSQHVLFLSEREGDDNDALYAIAVAGGEARRVAVLGDDIDAYHLCSDGRRVALVGKEASPEGLEERREQGFNAEIFEEDDRFSRVWLGELAAPGEKPVAPSEFLPVEGSVEEAAWSPSCDRLALKVAPSPLIDERLMFSRLHVVDAESGAVVGKVENPGKLGAFAWSADGRRLALITAADLNDPREGRLAVVEARGGAPRDLLPGLLGHVQSFAWQDGQTLLFLVHEGVEARVATVGVDGGGQTLLTSGGPIFTRLNRATSGALALIGSTPAHPDEVFHLDAEGKKATRLTDSNPWLADVELAPQEVVRFKARDGLELEGILIRPLQEKKNRRYPLILTVHGGPEAHHSNGWMTSYSRPGQTGAARGFAVFFINYRASTGRGVEFSKLDHGDPAGAEFDDLVDGVDHLIEIGLVDRDKVAITGGSYGGYATAWGATYYSERFAAAVMAVGISEKIAKMGTSEIPKELYLVHERKWPWEDWEHALERSPVYHVEKAKTPILILHGKKDTRVFPGQSMILYRAIKIATETPVRLVFYPEEGHGNRRAAARLDYALRQLRWIEHYILGPGGDPPAWPIDDYGLGNP